LRASAALAGIGAVAGCTQPSASGSGTTTTTTQSYSVSVEPMSEVQFDGVPRTWVANNGSWADMGIALGLEPPEGLWLPRRYHTQYYDEIPDVSVDDENITKLWGDGGVGKESFYELDGDVHIMDPNFLENRSKNWDEEDTDEVTERIAPMFGNTIFSRGYSWHSDYRYYTLYEGFEKLAEVFQRTERYEAFETLHDDFQADLAPHIPARSERPEVGFFWGGGDEPETFYPYVIDDGTSFKQWNDLKVKDALGASDVRDFYSERGTVDYETMLEVDPEVLLIRGQEAKSESEFQNTVVSYMKDHDTASGLTAVQNDDVYRAGPLYQGPILNLLLTERAAQQVYGVEGELFDRQRVADIVNGDIDAGTNTTTS